MIHRHLKSLLEDGLIKKNGKAPEVFYSAINKKNKKEYIFSDKIKNVLDKEFYFIDPKGLEFFGSNGFVVWCQNRGFNIRKKSEEFLKIYKKYKKVRKNNLLDASSKIQKTFGKKQCVKKLFYYDFYSIEIFGKTKIGQRLLYAKQSQDKKRIQEIAKKIKESLDKLIEVEKIDSVVFVPPTVPRGIQFMKILEKSLKLKLPKIKVKKIISDIRVPQKTLKKLKDRVENADNTFWVEENINFKNILIIDDAVGSGASINQIACKIKKNNDVKKIVGFATTGSLNDFEVISEV